MNKIILLLSIGIYNLNLQAQQQTTHIKQMTWGTDYQVYMKLSNDSSYALAIDELFHAAPAEVLNKRTEFVYYPVNFDMAYITDLLTKIPEGAEEFSFDYQREPQIRKTTLYGQLSQTIGGGWVHFTNTLMLALETRQLELTAPLLERPISTWKPKPVTNSWKRTHKWKYYVPVTQKQAKKEYKKREKLQQLGDLKSVPQSYIQLFLATSDKEYNNMLLKRQFKKLSQIDLIKVLLGSGYMGEPQIAYIKSRVLQAIRNYNADRKPTVLIFDEYQAAVAMTLADDGYKAERIVYRDQESLTGEEVAQRSLIINGFIALINESNKKAFKDRLTEYYK